ncbi:helix-turn-helix domain-containing protein [Desulfurobacterium crinifex]
MDNIGERLKLLRKQLGLTQVKFAEKLGRSKRSIQEWESGRNEPSERVLRLIEQTFSVNPEWLRHGKGEMFVKKKPDLEELLEEFTEEELDVLILALRIVRKLEKKKGIELSKKQRIKVARILIEFLEEDEGIGKIKEKLEKKGEKLIEAITA